MRFAIQVEPVDVALDPRQAGPLVIVRKHSLSDVVDTPSVGRRGKVCALVGGDHCRQHKY
eukprot:6115047-Prymnesium_polylepis.1